MDADGKADKYRWTTEMIPDPADQLGELGKIAELTAQRLVPVPHRLTAAVLRREYEDDDPRKEFPGHGKAIVKFFLGVGDDADGLDVQAMEDLLNDVIMSALIAEHSPVPDSPAELFE